jgi:hypothetical protein
MAYDGLDIIPKSRYAYVMSTNRKYMPGVNATLNALEFYGFEVDVYVLMTKDDFLEHSYKAQWPANVQFITIDTTFAIPVVKVKRVVEKWLLRFGTLDFTAEVLLDYYPVVVIEDSDTCPTSNWMDWFEVIEKSDKLAMSTIEFGSHNVDFSGLAKEWPYPKAWRIPYANCPLFVTPTYRDVLRKDISYQAREGCQLSVMNGLNYAMRDLGIKPLALPGEIWNCANPSKFAVQWRFNTLYFDHSATLVKIFHRAYWNATICSHYLNRNKPDQPPVLRHNKKTFNYIFNFFNKECRVKWLEGVELWDGK